MALSLDALNAVNGVTAKAATSATGSTDSSDRFLKLLVTQMQNQDPLNPMDNAQVTSQMAQINTVNGIDKLNTTVAGLGSQLVQMQALQGAALVGREVTLQGDRLVLANGQAEAGFDLASTADRVKVEVLNGAGRVVDTLELGAQNAGRHDFSWTPKGLADGGEYHFRIAATVGAANVGTTALTRDRVESVSVSGDRLTLQTQYAGSIDYSAVKAVN